ncbi:MAG: hypothetical protein KGY48_09240 [Wenzhouxiangellaceae bacterium]|nr:hypothetical protein [Wenzhouxiangellaceae bacterium]MBS3747070.1 hypothetical protein [Wenzhouxiangellaceae bacterium]MBS3824774.1 hypothetical protein [Wenzhouxiangellaceae bacterium]
MFEHQFSKMERVWLLGLRLVWAHWQNPGIVALVDRLYMEAGVEPCGTGLKALLAGLKHAGADHLYIERYDAPGLTGDERDLLAALKASYLDQPLEAEAALGAVLPPGRTDAVMGVIESITGGLAAVQRMRVTGTLPAAMESAACH